mgnify:CR=1 FL=1
MSVKNPKEINSEQYDREQQLSKWVSTMFSFLFGDGVAAFVMTKTNSDNYGVKIGKITHAVNFDKPFGVFRSPSVVFFAVICKTRGHQIK